MGSAFSDLLSSLIKRGRTRTHTGDLHQQGGAIIAGPGSQVHFSHFDTNRLDQMPTNWLLQLPGLQQNVDFNDKPKIIHV